MGVARLVCETCRRCYTCNRYEGQVDTAVVAGVTDGDGNTLTHVDVACPECGATTPTFTLSGTFSSAKEDPDDRRLG